MSLANDMIFKDDNVRALKLYWKINDLLASACLVIMLV